MDTTITVFVRHSEDCALLCKCGKKCRHGECPERNNPQWKKCKCRKSVYIYENGQKTRVSAKTRSWEQAEKFVQELRDARDPVKIALAKIQKQVEAKDASISDALDQWIKGKKIENDYSNRSAYATFKRVVLAWAESKGFTNLSDVTPDSLDQWVGSWSPDAKEEVNRLKKNTQKMRVAKIKAFFLWCYKLHKVANDPAAMLATIIVTDDDADSAMPLSREQYKQVMKATYKDTEFGVELRAIFLVMRWLGVRLIDALMLARSSVKGNRIKLTVIKTRNSTGAIIDRPVPDEVIQALAAVSRNGYAADKYFTTGNSNHRALSTMWGKRIKALNDHLDLRIEDELAGVVGEPMQFRSHQLRDTFAVEHLLAGMPLQDVSRLLTHNSVRTTEKYYAKWSRERRDKLEQETMDAMRRQGAVFAGD